MFEEDEGPAETAIGYTNQFVDAAVAKLDATFGAGHAKANPAALAAYVAACTGNLNALMTAAAAAYEDIAFDEALDAFQALEPEPAPKPKGRRR